MAYLLNLRAVQTLLSGNRDDAIADFVLAKRTRKDVIRYASPLVDKLENINKRYWVIAILYEAALGMGDEQALANWEAKAMAVPNWMQESRVTQADKLKRLLEQYGELIGK